MQMAQWLAAHWPDRLQIDWAEYEDSETLEKILHLLALYCETPGLDEFGFAARDWIARMKGPDETDATFVVQPDQGPRGGHLHPGVSLRASQAADDPGAPAPDGPSRTRAKVRGAKIFYQTGPLNIQRPDLRAELKRPPLSVRPVSERKGQEIIDLAREAMVTRSRDLDVFAFGDPRDVRMIDCGDGLQFAAIGGHPRTAPDVRGASTDS